MSRLVAGRRGDQRLLARRSRVHVDRRHAAEDEQRDALDLEAEPARQDRVRELVRQDRCEEQRGGRPATIQYWPSVQPRNWRGNWDPARE